MNRSNRHVLVAQIPDVVAILVFGALALAKVVEPATACSLVLAVLAGRLYPRALPGNENGSSGAADGGGANGARITRPDHDSNRSPDPDETPIPGVVATVAAPLAKPVVDRQSAVCGVLTIAWVLLAPFLAHRTAPPTRAANQARPPYYSHP